MKARAQSFLPGLNASTASNAHGGAHTLGRRKTRRPLDPNQALHVVLRSSKAHGDWSMLEPKRCRHIHDFSHRLAERWGVRIYRYANVGNHLHLLIRARSRTIFQRFLRELAGGIAIIVTGAKKGAAIARTRGRQGTDCKRQGTSSERGFWDHLAFTRIVSFGRDFERVMAYLVKNLFEAAGVPMKKLLAEGVRIVSIRHGPIVD